MFILKIFILINIKKHYFFINIWMEEVSGDFCGNIRNSKKNLMDCFYYLKYNSLVFKKHF